MKILYTQPIFLPNEYMLNRNLRSIESLSNLFTNGIDIDIRLGIPLIIIRIIWNGKLKFVREIVMV